MKREKSEKFTVVAEAILAAVSRRGPESVQTAEIARKAGVSRAWIYKNLGSGQESLLTYGVDHFGTLFLELGRDAGAEPLAAGALDAFLLQLKAEFVSLLAYISKYPGIVRLYFRYKGGQGPVSERIAHWESLHETRETGLLKRILSQSASRADPRLVSEQLGALRWGLAFFYAQGNLSRLAKPEQIAAHFIGQARELLQQSLRT